MPWKPPSKLEEPGFSDISSRLVNAKTGIANTSENDIDAFTDALDRSGVTNALPYGAMMPTAIGAGGKLGVKLLQMLNKSRLAKVGTKMPAFRYQEEAGKEFASAPGRGSIFATIGDISDRMHPNYNTSKPGGLIGEGGKNFVAKMVQPENPLMIDPRREGVGGGAVRALMGEGFNTKFTGKLYNAQTPDEALEIARKMGKFNNNELKALASHDAMNPLHQTLPGVQVSRMALIRDAMAAKQGKFYGFDAILPNTKYKRQAAEMMLLK